MADNRSLSTAKRTSNAAKEQPLIKVLSGRSHDPCPGYHRSAAV
ncbi:unnamed protein product [Acanthoscelides obtectus]|uniref:Uncharacterized protein n=1 Tax=Acanthoscelides obtectus TaxID=200917 RepID=A0A9P0KJB0_ACAOB|nr:unnamed protein product [Acanthoscelides obtectus]CAK1639591.1 hypothetical protein AOBTE_LOCUS11258 [Acanthoscelides obtectus]